MPIIADLDIARDSKWDVYSWDVYGTFHTATDEINRPLYVCLRTLAYELIMDLDCGAVLVDPDVVAVPDHADLDRVGFVGYTAITPGLESAGKASIAAAIHVRRTILSDPENPPIGPSGFEG